MVEATHVSVAYDRSVVVRDVSLTIEPGEWVALIGPNGAGKTTLLRALAGLIACSGAVFMDGRPLESLSRRELARRVALVPQSPSTPPELTVSEYVLLGRTPYIAYFASESAADSAAAAEALERLGLVEFAERRLHTLSGGELQRAVLARALAQHAPLLFLDEPTSALDLGRQQQVLEQVDTLRREDGLTVIAAMHDLSLASQFADRLILLDRGEVVAQGKPQDVISESRISAFYGANVRILHDNGEVFVLPRRRETG